MDWVTGKIYVNLLQNTKSGSVVIRQSIEYSFICYSDILLIFLVYKTRNNWILNNNLDFYHI